MATKSKAQQAEAKRQAEAIRAALKRCHVDSIGVDSVMFDWDRSKLDLDADPDEQAWAVIYPSYIDDADGYNEARQADMDEQKLVDRAAAMTEEHGDADSYEPMMSFFWPIKLRNAGPADADLLIGLPVTLVRIADGYGIALTGGGMDLSWEIAAAYVRLGQLPPVEIRLPIMAEVKRDRALILAACRQSATVMAAWMATRLGELQHVEEEMDFYARKDAARVKAQKAAKKAVSP